MIKCPNCGKEISDTSDICEYCNHNLSNKSATTEISINAKSENRLAVACKITAILFFIAAFFFGAYIASECNDFSLALCIWIGSFFSCMFLLGIGEIVNLLTILKDNLKK